jgi:hypothetical protein
MRTFRFTIAGLLGVITVHGIGLAALREASEFWDSGLFTLTLGVLLVSVLLAVHRREYRRAFWAGFALFGWGYVALSLVPSAEPRLVTTRALAYLDAQVPGQALGFTIRLTESGSGSSINQVVGLAFSPDGRRIAGSSQGRVGLWDAATGRLLGTIPGTTEDFVRIGHSLFALLAASVGGLVSRRLWRSPGSARDSRTVEAQPSGL